MAKRDPGEKPSAKNTPREAEIDLRMKMLQQWYGGRLTPKQWAQVREGVDKEVVEVSEALRAVRLTFTDEPQAIFRPYRKEG